MVTPEPGSDAPTVSFVVRLWVEEAATDERPAIWRGRVLHVTSGGCAYITRLDQIVEVIRPYAEALERGLPPPDTMGRPV
jgi:hypothetical protein